MKKKISVFIACFITVFSIFAYTNSVDAAEVFWMSAYRDSLYTTTTSYAPNGSVITQTHSAGTKYTGTREVSCPSRMSPYVSNETFIGGITNYGGTFGLFASRYSLSYSCR